MSSHVALQQLAACMVLLACMPLFVFSSTERADACAPNPCSNEGTTTPSSAGLCVCVCVGGGGYLPFNKFQ